MSDLIVPPACRGSASSDMRGSAAAARLVRPQMSAWDGCDFEGSRTAVAALPGFSLSAHPRRRADWAAASRPACRRAKAPTSPAGADRKRRRPRPNRMSNRCGRRERTCREDRRNGGGRRPWCRRLIATEGLRLQSGGFPICGDAGGEGRRFHAGLGALSRIHCENIHFSPEPGGVPACRVIGSGLPFRSTFVMNRASPTFPRKLSWALGNAVSPSV